jgi:hypothetical protein
MKRSKVVYYYMRNNLQDALQCVKRGFVKSYIFMNKGETK